MPVLPAGKGSRTGLALEREAGGRVLSVTIQPRNDAHDVGFPGH